MIQGSGRAYRQQVAALLGWELQKGSRQIQLRPEGQATFSGAYEMINTALCAAGLRTFPRTWCRSTPTPVACGVSSRTGRRASRGITLITRVAGSHRAHRRVSMRSDFEAWIRDHCDSRIGRNDRTMATVCFRAMQSHRAMSP